MSPVGATRSAPAPPPYEPSAPPLPAGDGCSDDRELASFLTTYFIDDHGYDVSDFNCAARMLTSLVNDDVAQSSLCDATLIEKGYTWRQFEEVRKESMVACGVDLAHQRDFPGLST